MMASILVVDDSPTVGSTVGWILNDHGYKIRVVSDGLSALNAIQTLRPDLILLDIKLPHVDGIELCKLIRQRAACSSIPIVMVSGLSAESDMERARQAGANNYLVKPVNDKKLLMIVQQELAKAATS